MKKYFLILIFLITASLYGQNITAPEKYFGFKPGADGMLFDYEKLISYLQELDKQSERLQMVEIGATPMGRPMYIAFISSPENPTKLERLKEINKILANDISLENKTRQKLINEGRVFVLATLSMHSNEVGPSQAAPLIAYELLTTNDPRQRERLNNVVLMLVPCHNPDGMDMVVNHYKRYKGKKYDGSSLPGIYHKYVGHDNNRDFITLSQSDTKAISKIFSVEWYPQVMVEKHQMGSRTARYFVPPMHDPITENIDATLWNWTWVFGSEMVRDMTREGLSGLSQHYLFDDYWPGSTETCIWKNTIGMLTEAASAKYATPIFVEANELQAYGKGLSEYKKSINMPEPWPGGWWRLSDIVKYEIESTLSIIKTAARSREEILKFRNDLAKKEVIKGKTEAPFYYVLPFEQHDQSEWVKLANLLHEHGIEVYRLTKNIESDGVIYTQGSLVVPLSQPVRPFIKEVMEVQHFPLRHYTPGGKIIKPYDITSWSLPLHRNIKVVEIEHRSTEIESNLTPIEFPFTLYKKSDNNFTSMLFTINDNESYKAAFYAKKAGLTVKRTTADVKIDGRLVPKGSFWILTDNSQQFDTFLDITPIYVTENITVPAAELKLPRIALVETYFHDMDAGWCRFVFDSYYIPYKTLRPGDFEKKDLKKNFDLIIFPDADKSILMEGKYKSKDSYRPSQYPPQYTKGMKKEGLQKLLAFINDGGHVVSWGRSVNLFMGPLSIKLDDSNTEDFVLPVENIGGKLQKDKLYCPGSLVKVELLPDHPLTMGMEKEAGVFYRGKPVFATSIPYFDMDRRVIAKFPERNILLSGYAEHIDKLADKTAMVWLKKGKGEIVLMGFNPQFRASTQGTFKLLFNAILL